MGCFCVLRLIDQIKNLPANTLLKIQSRQLLLQRFDLVECILSALRPIGLLYLISILPGKIVLPIGVDQLLVSLLCFFLFCGFRSSATLCLLRSPCCSKLFLQFHFLYCQIDEA